MKKQFLQSRFRIVAIVLLFIVALNALAAGYSFIADPSGRSLGITTGYLRESAPFKNYLIPGIFLFVVNGLLSAFIALLAILKAKHYESLILAQGLILIVWIGTQLTMVISFHPLHLIITLIGFVLMISGWLLKTKGRKLQF